MNDLTTILTQDDEDNRCADCLIDLDEHCEDCQECDCDCEDKRLDEDDEAEDGVK